MSEENEQLEYEDEEQEEEVDEQEDSEGMFLSSVVSLGSS
jgi:hypothetical protein